MIRVEGITKPYGANTAVDDVTFTAEPRRVTGFLGPNGAGKSTTMRVIVGLTPPTTTGAAYVLGRRFTDLPDPGLDVGVLLDASAQHGGRTGREILTLAQRTMGLGAGRVDEMLDLVSLTEGEASRRVRDYSADHLGRVWIEDECGVAECAAPALLDEAASGGRRLPGAASVGEEVRVGASGRESAVREESGWTGGFGRCAGHVGSVSRGRGARAGVRRSVRVRKAAASISISASEPTAGQPAASHAMLPRFPNTEDPT